MQHSGTYICTVHLPYLLAQVSVELEVVGEDLSSDDVTELEVVGQNVSRRLQTFVRHWVETLMKHYNVCSPAEPPSISLSPSPLPLAVPGQVLSVQCEASGFAPLPLELSWEFRRADGAIVALGKDSLSGHREAWDGTFTQSTHLELDTSTLGGGGELVCVAQHQAGTRRSRVTVEVIGERRDGRSGLSYLHRRSE